MRFEVRAGGIFAILVGVAFLSGGVFLMGLLAGYDIGRETQSSAQQVSTDYTVEAAASKASAPVAARPPANESAVSGGAKPAETAASPAAAQARGPAPAGHAPAPQETKAAIAAAAPPAPANQAENPPPEGGEAMATPQPTPEPQRLTSNPPPAHDARRKPFNIQIQAAMDSASAREMIQRLQSLGYQPHMVPTTINGATWYKVEVGPYATQAEAAAAESDLRQKYNSTYGRSSTPAQPGGDQQE
jgi:cell division septation protein DedD